MPPPVFLEKFFLPVLLLLTCCPPAFAGHKLTLVLIPLQSPSVMYANFLPLKRYLEGRLGQPVELKVANKRSEVIGSLERGEADIAFMCPTLYCTASKLMRIAPLARLRVNGSAEYRSVLLVRSDSDIKKTADLVDRTFVYGRYYCPGSGLLPEVLLQKVGIDDGDFMETVKLGSDESAILAVMARLFDATGVSEMAARPYLNKGLRILSYSYPIPQYLFAARAALGKPLLEKIRKAMLSVNSHNPKEVLGGIEPGADGLVGAEDGDYDIVRILMKSVLGDEEMMKPAKGSVRFVVEPDSFEPEMFKELDSLVVYLSRASGRRFQLVIPDNIRDFIRKIHAGEGDFFLQNHHLYSRAARDGYLTGIASVARAGHSGNRGLIIVSSGSPISTLRELDGKKQALYHYTRTVVSSPRKNCSGKRKCLPAQSILWCSSPASA
ncbi:MAG: PhnD/SsuA/transferrin family substrate-binding protein [Candidatus Sulfobium sp.]